jgi:hypothetical protein
MKASIPIFLIALSVFGAEPPKLPNVNLPKQQPKQMILVTGFGAEALTPDSLETAARSYAQERKLAFDFASAKTLIFVSTDADKEPVSIWFTLPAAKIALIVYFGRDGKISRHQLGPYQVWK